MKKMLISFLILLSLQGCGLHARVLSGNNGVLGKSVGERADILGETVLAP